MTHPAARVRKAEVLARTWQIAGGDAASFARVLEGPDARPTLDLLLATAAARMNRTSTWTSASRDTWELVKMTLEVSELGASGCGTVKP